MNIYRYRIKRETDEVSGLVLASSLSEAVVELENEFENEIYSIGLLKCLCDWKVIDLDEDVLDKIEEKCSW